MGDKDVAPPRRRFGASEMLIRSLLVVAGSVSVALGIAGIFLPLLPTTPFLLLAAACYVRSSPRLYRWLMNHRWTGEYIRDYREKRGLPLRTKILTVLILWATVGWSAYRVSNPWLLAPLFAVAVVIPIVILRLPTRRP